LRFCGWGPAAIITATLYRDPPNLLQNPPLPLALVPQPPPKTQEVPGGEAILWKTASLRKADKPSSGGGVVREARGKTRPQAAESGKPPSPRGGHLLHLFIYPAMPTQPAQVSTYAPARIQIPQSTALSLLSPNWPCGPQLAWGTPWLALCGRAPPPQIGRGHRGWSCRPDRTVAVAVVATYPPLRPGAAGWASGIPAGSPLPTPRIRGLRHSFGASRPAASDISPLPGRPPSRCRGRAEAQPSPPLAPRPPGLETQGKPVRAFLASHRVAAAGSCTTQGTGPPTQPFPVVLTRSPPLPHHGFRRPLARSTPRYGTGYSPWLTCVPHRPRQGSGRHAKRLPR